MRQQHIKPDTTPVFLVNYLPEKFTFYWDKEAYTLEPGEKMKLFRHLAIHGAVKMAEAYFASNPTNAASADPKVRGFYSRHEEYFKAKVKEAIIEPKNAVKNELSETANAVAMMNQEGEADGTEEKPKKGVIELPEVEDEIVEGCSTCRATGPRHKPTCPKYVKHPKDAAQATKLGQAAA